MRHTRLVIAMLGVLACRGPSSDTQRYGDARGGQQTGWIVRKDSPDYRGRADSLAALDPEREALAAAQRGDLRYIATCREECVPIGITRDSVCLLRGCGTMSRADVRTISGADAPEMNADVARLHRVVVEYGTRYNRSMLTYRKDRPMPRRVT
ncbi:MAG: hypothetical protein ABJE47_17955 [bacterium]